MKNVSAATVVLAVLVAGLLTALSGSCAKIVSPTGGSKDTDPPVVVNSVPPGGTVFFKSRTISVTFNEYVVLDKLNEKFMISPPMDKKPEISLKGKAMKIVLKEEPRENTTYTLYFQDAIKDLNEGNPILNFQYVFSTGSYLDSLSVTGNVVSAYDLNPAGNILVLLHSNLCDTAPRKQLPDYITIADKQGYFRIDNVKAGRYNLYALGDINGNKKYDLQEEMFAFSDTSVEVTPEKNYISPGKDSLSSSRVQDTATAKAVVKGDYPLYLFTAPLKKYYLTSTSRDLPYRLRYTLSLPPQGYRFEIGGFGMDEYFTERNTRGDTLTVWLLDSLKWSEPDLKMYIEYPYTDSSGNVIGRKDTVQMRFTMQKAARGKQPARKYVPEVNIRGGTMKPGEVISFSSPSPVREADTSQIKLYVFSRDVKTQIPFYLAPDTTSARIYFLNAKLAEGEKYLLVADKGAFRDIYGEISDSAGFQFTVRPANSYGRLIVKLTGLSGNVIIQLLDKSEKVLMQRVPDYRGEADFPLLEKGKYRLRAVFDTDGNGIWTTGDFDIRRQPEPVTYYPGEIDIMTDWVVEQEWDLGKLYEKSPGLINLNSEQNRR